MKKASISIFAFLVLWAAASPSVGAAEAGKNQSALTQILAVEGRGAVNIITSPCEFVRTVGPERKLHPKVWPLSYVPRAFMNTTVRLVSGVNDMLVLPWYMIQTNDSLPMTSHFDLPKYCWQKE